MDYEKTIRKLIEAEKHKIRMGSGDDEFYANQVEEFLLKQKQFLIDCLKFLELEVEHRYTAWCPSCSDALICIPIQNKEGLITGHLYNCEGCDQIYSLRPIINKDIGKPSP